METATTDAAGAPAAMASGALLLVDKPAGFTSHDVIALVRRAARTRRVGHAGTLDPFATGLLVVLIGRGTRLIPYVDGEPKVYEATIRFGAETDTDDVTGTVTTRAPQPDDPSIAEGIARLTGTIDQIPPDYSAKQVGGRRAYAAARTGAPLVLAPSRVTVHGWTVLGRDGENLHVRITCGGGTYIRALARDLGRLAGSAAHLAVLRRVRAGAFDVANAVSIDDVRAGDLRLAPLRDAIPSMAARSLDDAELVRVGHGNAIEAREEQGRVSLVDGAGELVAIAEREGAQLRPRLVLRDG